MELSEICSYCNSRVKVDTLTIDNYISTENMVANKGGIVPASKISPEAAIEFLPGDILISNIRPYFKKIWLSDRNGGCSTDVLCIRANHDVNEEYLYC